MPEVPNDQAPSREEVLLSSDPQPQPSEATLDQQTAEQQQAQVPDQPSSEERVDVPSEVPPSEGGNVVPVAPEVGLDADNSPYKEGDSFPFTSPSGESYSLSVTKVEGDQITLQNSTPGAEAVIVPLEQAKAILESSARSR